jgi:formate/nitrite transporter FocA (FNT family)
MAGTTERRNGHSVRVSADQRAPETTTIDDEEPKPLGHEAPEIVEDASKIGRRRLERPLVGDAITSFIGGMSVCFGAVAMVTAAGAMGGGLAESSPALLIGALVFPVGFVILLVGKSELFTENFLLPVTGVLENRGTLRQLSALWTISLSGNLIGVLIFALLVSRGDVLSAGAVGELRELAEHKVEYGLLTAFIKALFAGWLITVLTWLLLAADGMGPRLVMIWIIGTLIVLGQFNHVVISAAEIFMAMLLGASITPGEWFSRNFVPALAGNMAGGLVFETLLQYVQARYQQAHDEDEGRSAGKP